MVVLHSLTKHDVMSAKKQFILFLLSFLFLNATILASEYREKPILLREPYLQMVRSNTTTITWKTNAIAETCSVIIRKENSKENIKIEGSLNKHEGNKFNEVLINNLQPNTKYYYSIHSNGYELASGSDYFFITTPKNKTKPFSFYALGDIGAKLPYSFADKPAKTIQKLKIQPKFGIGLGDIVYSKGESEFYDKQLFEPFQNVFKNIPFYPVPGNHDWGSDPEQNFEKEWSLPNNEHYYSFTYTNTLLIGLDSSDSKFYNFEEQLEWLQNTLTKNKGMYDWIIIYLHHNGKTCTYKPNYQHVIELYKTFANNDVDLVLNGHAHTYERLRPYDASGNIDMTLEKTNHFKNLKNKFISITVGAGGKLKKGWTPDTNNSNNCKDGSIVSHYEHVPSFGLISIDGNKLKFEGINSEDGTIFDTFTIEK